jgi:hypothetical protein
VTQVLWKCMRRDDFTFREDMLHLATEPEARAWLEERKETRRIELGGFHSHIGPSYWIEPVAVGVQAKLPERSTPCGCCGGKGYTTGPKHKREYAG